MAWDSLNKLSLIGVRDPVKQRLFFHESVRMVEIEVFSYCNRRCWFCPNSIGDRIKNNKFMDDKIYIGILENLREVDYSKMITYSRYNEPFSDKIILEKIRLASAMLPNAALHSNTNGDYLSNEYIHEIYDAGLRSLNIQVYLGAEDRYNHDKIIARADTIEQRLNLRFTETINNPGLWYERNCVLNNDFFIRLYGRNFEVNGTDRGATVPIHTGHVRVAPCLFPFWAVYIDYNGKIVPCCNVRTDLPQHADCEIGDLSQNSDLFSHFAGAEATRWRRHLLTFDEKAGVCRSCSFGEERDTEENRRRIQELWNDSDFFPQ